MHQISTKLPLWFQDHGSKEWGRENKKSLKNRRPENYAATQGPVLTHTMLGVQMHYCHHLDILFFLFCFVLFYAVLGLELRA
jgi:hypothetical protein